jgi:energy-coupling factor transporter transmembrane protein EcfT
MFYKKLNKMPDVDKKQSKSRRLINIVLFVMLILFAVIQLNDQDPMLWFSIYAFTAVLALASNYLKIPKWFLWLVLALLLVYSITYFPFLIDWLQTENKNELFGEMVYEKPYLEGTREFLGLIISALVVAFLLRK